jgi:RecA/RadA recombinase
MDAALRAIARRMRDIPLFVPSVRRYIPMRHAGLATLLAGPSRPGLPTGIWIEIVGQAGSGKTSTCFAMIEAVVSQPPVLRVPMRTAEGIVTRPVPRCVLVLDFEHTLDLSYMLAAAPSAVLADVDQSGRVRNADRATVYVHQPSTLEEGVDLMVAALESEVFGLVVVDSVPAMLPSDEAERTMSQNTVGLQARAMGKMFRRVTPLLAAKGATVVLVNQWRDKIGVVFGDPRTTPGGKATAYYDAIKLDISGPSKTPYFADGKVVKIKAIKNKITGARREVVYHLQTGYGLSAEVELYEAAVRAGVILASPRSAVLVGRDGQRSSPLRPSEMIRSLAEPSRFQAVRALVLAAGGSISSLSVSTESVPGTFEHVEALGPVGVVPPNPFAESES